MGVSDSPGKLTSLGVDSNGLYASSFSAVTGEKKGNSSDKYRNDIHKQHNMNQSIRTGAYLLLSIQRQNTFFSILLLALMPVTRND